MILGLGNDLIDIRRIERTLDRFGPRFVERTYTPVEQAAAARRAAVPRMVACTYAKRFAAKEACAKALGTGLAQGVALRDIGVVDHPRTRPTLALTGGAARRLLAMTPAGSVARLHLSMSDDYPFAQAVVIISAEPEIGHHRP